MEDLFVYITSQNSGFAYLMVFGILVACGLGFPLPEDMPLMAAGYLCWEGTMDPFLAFLVTMAGVLLGDTALYMIGSKLGPAIIAQGLKGFISEKRLMKTQAYFTKYGDKIVFFARFIAGLRAGVFFMAGTLKMPYKRFILLDGIAALLSIPIWLIIGYQLGNYFGNEIEALLEKMHHLKTNITIGIVVIVLLFLIHLIYKIQTAKKTQD